MKNNYFQKPINHRNQNQQPQEQRQNRVMHAAGIHDAKTEKILEEQRAFALKMMAMGR